MSRSFPVVVSLNLISMISNVFTLLVSTVILGFLIKSLIQKGCVNLLLYTNNYIAIFGHSLLILIDNVDMYRGDFGLFVGEETFLCRLRGYLIFVFASSVRYALALQVCYSEIFLNENEFV